MNNAPTANRIHIGFFGCRNAGKSSLVNAITNQEISIVSDIKGTTTDPVSKSMELLPLGPVVIIDTPGIDDFGLLGELRVRKTKQILNKTDIAVLIIDGIEGITQYDKELISIIKEKAIPYLIVVNKSEENEIRLEEENVIYVSALTGKNINDLKEKIANSLQQQEVRPLVSDLIKKGDIVLLITPIDESAPKGRLILPQQQVIRDILECGGITVVIKETELKETLEKIEPAMVITDSQVFKYVSSIVPENIPLTSFSILMARYKGFLEPAIKAIEAIDNLKDGDTVLIAEGCTHHRQCNDIGTVKIPNWLKDHTNKQINIKTSSGTEFPEDLSEYAVIIHCGGCMITEKEVQYRMKCAIDQNIPFTNYGIVIAYINGILERSIKVLKKMG